MDIVYILVAGVSYLLGKSILSPATSVVAPTRQSPQNTTYTDNYSKAPFMGDQHDLIDAVWDRSIPNFDYPAYAIFTGYKEARNDYRPYNDTAAARGYPLGMNQLGFTGMYQMGAQALETLGYIKAGTWATPGTGGNVKILTTTANWTSKCPGGVEQFLSTPEIQERAMLEFTKWNYNDLKRSGVLSDASPPSVKAGYLAAAHLGGASSARKLARGEIVSDANGVTTKQRYDEAARTQPR